MENHMELVNTIKQYVLNGLPPEIGGEEIKFYFNQNTGFCCIEDSMEREARLNRDGKLETYCTCHNCGNVGFLSEMPMFDTEYGHCIECKL